ncbi:flagellar protein FlgN [Paenibacillus silvisoli]|uniref:flagellar protein FlgN n=1 Tax=Paenibacillus silvisoli TaxID=3110539 RepID=UPI002804EE32|nr:flagellar protein FlgN [Paenibacillus silvisoli]
MTVDLIITTLEQQADAYRQLLELAKEKTPYLVHNQVEQLNVVLQKERKLLKTTEELEQLRMKLSGNYFASIGMLRYKGGKISELIRTVTSSQDKKRLIDLHAELIASLDELQRASQLNQQLIEQSLKFIDYSIDLMVEDPSEGMTYQNPRHLVYGTKRNGLFDTRG